MMTPGGTSAGSAFQRLRLTRGSAFERAVSVATAVAALGSPALLAVAHVNDSSRLDSPAGSWFGLAHSVNGGTLSPPLYDGHASGGTRSMPLSFVLIAGVERIAGDDALAGKIVSLVVFSGLLAVVYRLVRRERARDYPVVGRVDRLWVYRPRSR
jgi:hypothetical protein